MLSLRQGLVRLAPSKEPWPFSHGYRTVPKNSSSCIGGLQWSHGLSAMDTLPESAEKTTSLRLQRSHDPSAMDTFAPGGTPSSNVILQWSHGLLAMDTPRADRPVLPARAASMEPRLFSHGYPDPQTTSRSAMPSFNGAMAFQPWIRRGIRIFRPNGAVRARNSRV